MISERKLAANRANAAKSTGPRTARGKARSARNGTSHGLAGRRITLTRAERGKLRRRVAEWSEHYRPEGEREALLVARAALATVVLDRIRAIDEAAWAEAARTGEPVGPEVFRLVVRYEARWSKTFHQAIRDLDAAARLRASCPPVARAETGSSTRDDRSPSPSAARSPSSDSPSEPTEVLAPSSPVEPMAEVPKTPRSGLEHGVISRSEPTEILTHRQKSKRFAADFRWISRVAASLLLGGLIGAARSAGEAGSGGGEGAGAIRPEATGSASRLRRDIPGARASGTGRGIGIIAGNGHRPSSMMETLMDTPRIARILDEMGTLLEVRGENPFRCRAYHNASQALKGLPEDLSGMIAEGTLAEVPGIGATMLEKVRHLAESGELPEYEELKRGTPPGLVALLRVPGLGPKKIKQLRDELGIASLADLKAAAESGKIAGLKGFGEKTAAKVKEGIAFVEKTGDRVLQSTARRLVSPVVEAVRAMPGVIRAEVCGSLRRRAETIGDLDILFSANDPATILERFVGLSDVVEVLGRGPSKASVRLSGGVQCDLRGVLDAQFPFALHYFTGSKAHNIAMRRRAIARGGKLSEYGLEIGEKPIACEDEAGLFEALGLSFIPPELREDQGEFEAAEAGSIPRLVELSDLTGTFHCHSNWSDGGNTIAEMAEAARALGLKYLGIADHSKSAGYAGGLSVDRVKAQWAEIDALNAKYKGDFRVFKGTECDILGDGSLDFPDDVLAGFDYVVASVHSLFGLSREAMTARIVRAVSNPRVTMLGHPTGRLLLARDAYPVDLDAVIDAAARAGTMIEINASPHRLDLDAEHARKAKALGIPVPINPDAHSTGGLNDLDYGVGIARRAGLGARDVFNARPLAEVASSLSTLRGRSGADSGG